MISTLSNKQSSKSLQEDRVICAYITEQLGVPSQKQYFSPFTIGNFLVCANKIIIDSIKIFVAPRPSVFLDFSVKPLPIINETLPPARTSSRSVFGLILKLDKTLLLSSKIFSFEKI